MEIKKVAVHDKISIKNLSTHAMSFCSNFAERFNKPPSTLVLDQPSQILPFSKPFFMPISGGTVSNSGVITEQNFSSCRSYLNTKPISSSHSHERFSLQASAIFIAQIISIPLLPHHPLMLIDSKDLLWICFSIIFRKL
jgi:hypothetical protein